MSGIAAARTAPVSYCIGVLFALLAASLTVAPAGALGRTLPGAAHTVRVEPTGTAAGARVTVPVRPAAVRARRAAKHADGMLPLASLAAAWSAADCAIAARGGTSRILGTSKKQLQKKFKHAGDFGVTGNYSGANASKFSSAINQHINSDGVKAITGTYRGNPATHHVDPRTGLNVISDPAGNFVSGWKLSAAQLENVLNRGESVMGKKNVEIALGHAEALVLFDWLARFNENRDSSFEDQAEERALFDLEAALENVLVEPLQADYKTVVMKARDEIRDEE